MVEGARRSELTAITDDSGTFRFVNVVPGAYRLAANQEGYLRGEYGARAPGRPGTRLTVVPGQALKDIVIAMIPEGAISGYVYTREGDPLRNATVQLLKPLYVEGRRMLTVWHQTSSGDGGAYRFAGLHPGEYVVSATPREAGAAHLPVYFAGTTDVDAAAPINLPAGVDYGGVNLNVVEEDAARIYAHVIDGVTGVPPSAIFMVLWAPGRRTLIAGSTAPRRIRVADDGTFVIEAVAPGLYELTATVGDGSQRLAARTSVRTGTDPEVVRLVLQPGFDVRGRVSIAGSTPREQETNLPRVRVRLAHEPYIAQVAPPTAAVAPDGTFQFNGVMPGNYRIRVTTGFNAYIAYARFGGADILNSAVNIVGTDEIEIGLSPHVAELDAYIFDNANAPVEAAQVVLAPDHPKRERLDLYRTGLTDGSGHIHLKELGPGDYKIFAWDFLESGAWQDADFIQRHEHLGTRIKIGETVRETVNLKVIPARE